MTSAPELRPAATSAAIVAVAGASSVILPTGAHWAVAGGAAIAAAVLAVFAYRIFNLWLPIVPAAAGVIALRRRALDSAG